MNGKYLAAVLFLVFGVVFPAIFIYAQTQPAPYNGVLMKVPLSGAAWVPPGQQQQQATTDSNRLAAMEAKIDKILKLLEDAAGPDPAGAAVTGPPQALIDGLGTCVQCHADRVSKQKGDGFVLFTTSRSEDNKEQSLFREDFSARELRNIKREVEEGLMPKKTSGKVLTPDQKTAILNEVKALIAKREEGGGK